jgi:hypothetical protein
MKRKVPLKDKKENLATKINVRIKGKSSSDEKEIM